MNRAMWYVKIFGHTFYFNSAVVGIITTITIAFLMILISIVLFCMMLSGLYSLGGWWLILASILTTVSVESTRDGFRRTYVLFNNSWFRKFLMVCFLTTGLISFVYHF